VVFHGTVCCDAPFRVLFLIQQKRHSLPRARRRVALFRVLSAAGPHPPPPSPKERERFCITFIIFITTTSALVLYSSFSESFYFIKLFEKRGLCLDGLLFWRRSGGGPLLIIFEELVLKSNQAIRKARAVVGWPPLLEEVGRRLFKIRRTHSIE
jgi:hypothetical protein